MWHLATSKGGKVLLATQTWRNRPGFPSNATTPTFPRPAPNNPAVTCGPLVGAGRGPRESEGGTSGRAKEEITESIVEMFLLDHRTQPPRQQRGDASFPRRGPSGEQNSHPKSCRWGRLSPPSRTYLEDEQELLLKSLSLSFLQSKTQGGKRCACIFVQHTLLEFPSDHPRERWRLRRQVQCWPRLPAKSCSLRGGRRGPRPG